MTYRIAAPALLAAAVLTACVPAPGERPTYPPRERPATGPAGGAATTTPALPMRSYSDTELAAFPRGAEQVSGPAVLSLLEQARTALDSGQSEQAIASLETAIDIEPRNPFVWQQLADAHLRQNLADQAEHQAQRSNSFAHGNPYIEIDNWRLIGIARTARGDHAGAQQAQDRIAQLQAILGR